jgi:prepilin-type N-terminal cleavage/methylation domain-containing protein
VLKKIVKGFTIIELLVVLAVIGVFAGFAYPNISNWITDREVRKETLEIVSQVKEIKSKVVSGEYKLGMVHFQRKGNKSYSILYKRYMNRDDYAYNYSGSTYVSGNSINTCDYDDRKMKYQKLPDYLSTTVTAWAGKYMCISTDGTKNGYFHLKDPETNRSNIINGVIFCSEKNNGCQPGDKNEFRYLITWDSSTNIKVYRYNQGKDKWCKDKNCYSTNKFGM